MVVAGKRNHTTVVQQGARMVEALVSRRVISAKKVLFRTLFLIGFERFLCTNCYN